MFKFFDHYLNKLCDRTRKIKKQEKDNRTTKIYNTNSSKIIKSYNGKGSLIMEINKDSQDNIHKNDGPALILYDDTGYKKYEAWYKKGVLHRDDAPAISYHCHNIYKFYIDGKEIEYIEMRVM